MKNVSASDAATDYVTQLPDNDKAKPVSEIDFYTIDEAWVNSRKHYTETASANAVDTAVRLFRELCEN